jgi:hypothetical protein
MRLGNLPPFALGKAFPFSLVRRYSHDYYGGSDSLGVSPVAVPVFPAKRTFLGSLRFAVRFLATPQWSVAWPGVLLNDWTAIILSEG